MLLDDPSLNTTDEGRVIAKLALAVPCRSKVAALAAVAVLIVAPPVAMRAALGVIITVPGAALDEISPKPSPLRVEMVIVLTIVASTVAIAVAACIGDHPIDNAALANPLITIRFLTAKHRAVPDHLSTVDKPTTLNYYQAPYCIQINAIFR